MIDKARFENFRALRDLEMSLNRLSVLVGPNAVGKSTVLRALSILGNMGSDDQNFVRAGLPRPEIFCSSGSVGPVKLAASDEKRRIQINLRVESVHNPQSADYAVWKWQIDGAKDGVALHGDGQFEWPRYNGSHDQATASYSQFLWNNRDALAAFGPCFLSRFDAGALCQPSYTDAVIPVLSENGTGLASVLQFLKLQREDDFKLLESALVTVVPSVRHVHVRRSRVRTTEVNPGGHEMERLLTGEAVFLEFHGQREIPADSVSEGTLLVLGILAAILSPNRPRMLLLDDIERGLHPVAIRRLLIQIHQLLDLFPDLQIVATSHSPYLIDECRPDEVQLMTADVDSGAVIGRLTDHPDFDRWKDTMLTGEFWSMVGEKWLLDKQGKAHAAS